jgi:hypothetical protein
MPIPGLDARGIIPELKLRLKFYCSWIWCVFIVFFFWVFHCCFVHLLYYWGFFTLIPTFFFSFCTIKFHHHYILISPLFPFILPPSTVLQSIALLPKYSFGPLSSSLSPCLHLLLWSSPNLSQDYHSLLYTHHLLTNLLYQLYIIPTPCNPSHKHPTLQQQKYTQTHKKVTKSNSPHILMPLTHPTFCLHF